MAKQNISATLDSKLLQRLDVVADEEDRNRSWLINKAVEAYLEDIEDLRIAKSRLHDDRLTPKQLRKLINA